MKNKGFTLVELLAVISVLGVVAILVMPTMLESLRNGKKMLSEYDLQGVEDAGRMYITDLDEGVTEFEYLGTDDITLNGHVYKKGEKFTSYDLKEYLRNNGGLDVDMRTLVKGGYYDKNCRYKGETIDGEVVTKDQNCHMPDTCILHVDIEQELSPDGRYYVTSGYTSKIKSGCEPK